MDENTIKTLHQESKYIRNRVDDIYNFVSMDRERISKVEIITNENKKDIDSHLENHWKIVGIIVTIVGIIITIMNTIGE